MSVIHKSYFLIHRSVRWNNSSIGSKVDCFKEAKILPRSHFLLIDSSAILEDKDTIAKMINKPFDFVTPMLRTTNEAQMRRICARGWNRTDDEMIEFPTSEATKRGFNFVLYEMPILTNSTSVHDAVNFWAPNVMQQDTEL